MICQPLLRRHLNSIPYSAGPPHGGEQVGNAGMTHVAQIASLKRLDLFGARVSDRGAYCLRMVRRSPWVTTRASDAESSLGDVESVRGDVHTAHQPGEPGAVQRRPLRHGCRLPQPPSGCALKCGSPSA
jgi:hypothetical protein